MKSMDIIPNGPFGRTIEIKHDGLGSKAIICGVSGENLDDVAKKAYAKMAEWDKLWKKRQSPKTAEQRTLAALDEMGSLENMIHAKLVVDWESLHTHRPFPISKPVKKELPPPVMETPGEPKLEDEKYQKLAPVFVGTIFHQDHNLWREGTTFLKAHNAKRHQAFLDEKEKLEQDYQAELAQWEKQRDRYIRIQVNYNTCIGGNKKSIPEYLGGDTLTIRNYFGLVLSNSKYPDFCPQSYDLQYNSDNKILIVDYQLPPKESLPTLKDVKYNATRDQFIEKHISEAALSKLFDSVLYQITLRTVHELFESDKANALSAVVFNGYVKSINPATGHEQNVCVLSMQAGKEEFLAVNLANVDPKACFKAFKGVGSAKLSTITPIAPLLKMNKEDKRFVDSYDVAGTIQEGDNLAMMDWEDFEHLIRELFQKEFTGTGGEVKVTRASRDGGIDAVVFDPDPIHGGKIVIQAKRYANTVGVSAVRDLFGAMMNEGANKGILVTTADYGSDAYDFARGKPLVLLNGGNLLHLLEKHGHKARIDLKEAKAALSAK